MWEAEIQVAAGPWHVGVRFESAEMATQFRDAFAARLLPPSTEVPPVFSVRSRAGVGWSVTYGERAVLRRRGPASLWEAIAWLLAGLAHARAGIGDTAGLRLVAGSRGAVLLASTRPELLGAHAWAKAGLVELPMLRVVVDGDDIVLPDPSTWRPLTSTAPWAGRRLPILGLVAKSLDGEMRDDTLLRLQGLVSGDGATALLTRLGESGRVRTGGQRARLLRHVLGFAEG